MSERNIKAAELGKLIGRTRQSMYLLLKRSTRVTYDWAPLVAALGGSPPSGMPTPVDLRLREIVRRWPMIGEDDKLIIEFLVRRFSAKTP